MGEILGLAGFPQSVSLKVYGLHSVSFKVFPSKCVAFTVYSLGTLSILVSLNMYIQLSKCSPQSVAAKSFFSTVGFQIKAACFCVQLISPLVN